MSKKAEKENKVSDRKLDHIRIVREENVEPLPSAFEKYELPYKALPEVDLTEIDTSVEFFGKKLSFPFVISSMTGGPDKAAGINQHLAEAAEQTQVALGLGSMRVILRKPESLASFNVRKYCPSVPLFANMGIVQLNYGYGADEINKLIDLVDADGIFLHVNALQEAIQPEGDTNFKGLLSKLEKVIKKVEKPIIIKEVGNGIDFQTAKRLYEIGIDWIDVSGLGGTSWPWVEGYRREDDLGYKFRSIGIPTDQALLAASKIKGLNLIAGGGIRSGIDIYKSLALGAKLATSAKPLLEPALTSTDATIKAIKSFEKELRIAMFVTGTSNIPSIDAII